MTNCTQITVQDFLKMKAPSVRLVDIRSESEYAKEHIPGAECIPMHKLNNAVFAPNEYVVFHDQSGHRMKLALKVIQGLKVGASFVLEGGLAEWKNSKLETEHSATISNDAKASKKLWHYPRLLLLISLLGGLAISYSLPEFFASLQSLFENGFMLLDRAGLLDWQLL